MRPRRKSRAAIEERITGHWALDDERWRGHAESHKELASNLTNYKSDANEWRATLSDLRGNFLTKSEFDAEHRALRADLTGEIKALDSTVNSNRDRISALETARATGEATDLVQATARADEQRHEDSSRARAQWMIGIAVAVTSIIVSMLVTVIVRIVTG